MPLLLVVMTLLSVSAAAGATTSPQSLGVRNTADLSYEVFRSEPDDGRDGVCFRVDVDPDLHAEVVERRTVIRESCWLGRALEESRQEPYVELGAATDGDDIVFVGLLAKPGWEVRVLTRSGPTAVADPDRFVVFTVPRRHTGRSRLTVTQANGSRVAKCTVTYKQLSIRCSPGWIDDPNKLRRPVAV